MPGKKRVSGASDKVSPEKKGRKVDQHPSITDALTLSSLPKEVAVMLNSILPHAVAPDGSGVRHRFQDQVLDVISKELVAIENRYSSSIEECKNKINEGEVERTRRAVAVTAAQEQVEKAIARLQQLQVAAAAAISAVRQAKETHGNALAVKSVEVSALDTAMQSKKAMEEAIADLEKLVNSEPSDQPPENGKIRAAAVRKELALCLQDAAMLDAAEMALGKAPDVRGAFDKMVLSQLEQEARKSVEQCKTKIEEAGPLVERVTATEQACSTKVEELHEQQQTAEIDASNAEAAKQEAEAAHRVAVKHEKSLDSELAQAQHDSSKAQENLFKYQEGALADFAKLRSPPISA